MRTRYRLIAAAVAVAALSLGGLLASVTPATAALPEGTLAVHTPLLKPGPSYQGDVVFSGTGWTPDHPVIVELHSDSGPFGPAVLSAHTVIADQDGAIAGSWTPNTSFFGAEFAFTAREEATAANGYQTRPSNVVPLLVYPTAGVRLDVGSFFLRHIAEGDATWGGGVEFESSGWTPGATVHVGVYRWADINTFDDDSSAWVADENGIVEGVWQPTSLIPELVGSTGYPAFEFLAVEVDPDGEAVKASNAEELSIVRSGGSPVIEVVDPVYPPGSFTRGIQVVGSGFTPHAAVTVYLWVVFDSESSGRYHEVTQADDAGRISMLMGPNPAWPGAFLPENGYPQYIVQAAENGGDGSQIVAVSNEALLTIDDGDDSGGPGNGGGDPAEAEGHLPATGNDQGAVATVAGLGAGALLLGVLGLIVVNRRRLAGPATRR